jgi:hypothetical protein
MELQLATAYASIALLITGCTSIVLSALFHSKLKKLKGLSEAGLAANVYNKTFIVFNPYPENRKMIHSYLPLWAIIAGFTSFAASLASFVLMGMGFGLSIFAVLAGLSLIVIDDAFDVYKNSDVFIKAIGNGSNLGVGDLEVFSILKVYARRLSYYYLCVGIFLVLISLVLPRILNHVMLAFAFLIAEIIQLGSVAGPANCQFGVLLFSMAVVLFEILIMKIKSKIFKI